MEGLQIMNEWMIENELKRICNSHGVVRKSSQEVLVQSFGDKELTCLHVKE
jgi:hypothetical protein